MPTDGRKQVGTLFLNIIRPSKREAVLKTKESAGCVRGTCRGNVSYTVTRGSNGRKTKGQFV